MKITVDLTSLSYHLTGMERYALCITEQMIRIDKDNHYLLIFRDKVHETFVQYIDHDRIESVVLHGNNKLLFYQMIMPFRLYRIKSDKYIFFAFTSPILFHRKGIINTIHDCGAWDCPQAMKWLQKLYFRVTTRISAWASESIITVSHFSKGRISKILKIKEEKIKVIYCALPQSLVKEPGVDYEVVKRKYGLPEKYIMSLSTLEPRKNLRLLFEVFMEIADEVGYDLVLVGRNGWKMKELLDKFKNQSRIHLTGFVEDGEVARIYQNAMCFVFPSLYEGFGMPPIEALAFGVPVLASDGASLPEILMDRAVYFENDQADSLKEKLLGLEKSAKEMPDSLNDYQKAQYDFAVSAGKVLDLIKDK